MTLVLVEALTVLPTFLISPKDTGPIHGVYGVGIAILCPFPKDNLAAAHR